MRTFGLHSTKWNEMKCPVMDGCSWSGNWIHDKHVNHNYQGTKWITILNWQLIPHL